MIHGILPCSIHKPDSLFPQSLSKFSLVYLLARQSQLHTPYISSPNHCLLFTAHAHTIATCFAVVPRLCHLILDSLLTLYLELFCSFTPHIHITILISARWSATLFSFLSYGPGLTSMQHTTSHTTAVQSPSHFQWYILIGKQWYQLPEFLQRGKMGMVRWMCGIKLQDRVPSKELRETRIRWHNLGTTAKQAAMVWACAVNRRQWLGEEMYGVFSWECLAKR